jgi:dihydrofolate synthase/folylpolyglutamate synthase
VEAVGDLFPGRKVTLVVGASQEKDLEGMARVWGPWAERIFLTEAPVPRAEPAQRLKGVFARFHHSPLEIGPVKEMLDRASKEAGPGGLVVVAGSLFVAAEGLRFFGLAPLPEQEEAGSHKSG